MNCPGLPWFTPFKKASGNVWCPQSPMFQTWPPISCLSSLKISSPQFPASHHLIAQIKLVYKTQRPNKPQTGEINHHILCQVTWNRYMFFFFRRHNVENIWCFFLPTKGNMFHFWVTPGQKCPKPSNPWDPCHPQSYQLVWKCLEDGRRKIHFLELFQHVSQKVQP